MLVSCQIKKNLSDAWKNEFFYLKYSICKNASRRITTILILQNTVEISASAVGWGAMPLTI